MFLIKQLSEPWICSPTKFKSVTIMIKNIPSKLEKNNIENLNKVKYKKKNQSSKLLEHPPLPPQKKTTKKKTSQPNTWVTNWTRKKNIPTQIPNGFRGARCGCHGSLRPRYGGPRHRSDGGARGGWRLKGWSKVLGEKCGSKIESVKDWLQILNWKIRNQHQNWCSK